MAIGNSGPRGPQAGTGLSQPSGQMGSRGGQQAGIQLALEERVRRLEEMLAKVLEMDRAGNLSIIMSGEVLIEGSTVRLLSRGAGVTIGGGRVDVSSQGVVNISGRSIDLDAQQDVRLTASGSVQLNASAVRTSSGAVNFEAGLVQASGLIKCDTIQANTVMGSSYTPGAGNIW